MQWGKHWTMVLEYIYFHDHGTQAFTIFWRGKSYKSEKNWTKSKVPEEWRQDAIKY